MNYLSKLTDDELINIGLKRDKKSVKIIIPDDVNIYHMTLGNHLSIDRKNRLAIIFEELSGKIIKLTFGEVEEAANGLAVSLKNLGYGFGDLIAIHTGQHPDTAIAHMAICKIGGVAVTLSQLYGPETLKHILNDCKVGAIITSDNVWGSIRSSYKSLFPNLKHIIIRNPQSKEIDLAEALKAPHGDFKPNYGRANDPALLMYTSGSTGKPKGILHGHRVLASYRPSINLFFNLSMNDDDAVFWSPSDWAWVGGLLDMLFPAWMAGRTIATSEHRFKADWAFKFMEKYKVTHTFLAPTAIKRLAQTIDPHTNHSLSLRVICTGGEALASETLEWAENNLKVICNEFYGMTEVNHLVGNCAALFDRKPGSMGLIYPGHDVRIINDKAQKVKINETGEIVTTGDSPTRFLGYFNNKDKEDEMKLHSFLRTHDLATKDGDGYFWYKGRSDDLIKSSGFRIGPTEIEDSLISHPAVAEAAVVGKPDKERGAIVKAFIKLGKEYKSSQDLKENLKNHVKENLAAYKAPREISFVKNFELTSSGKINRRVLREAEEIEN